MLVRYVTTLMKSSSERSLKAENSGKVMIGAPSFPRPPAQEETLCFTTDINIYSK